MKKIIIAGGSGFIGNKLAAELNTGEFELIILSRGASSVKNTNIRNISVDYSGHEELTKIIEGSYCIINLAGASLDAKRWSVPYKKLITDSRVNTTSALVRAVNSSANPPEIFISASAVGYYGNSENRIVNEHSEPGTDFLSSVCRKWEAAANEIRPETRLVIARLGVVLDSKHGAFPKMILPFRLFAGGPLGSGKQWLSWVHIADLTAMFVHTMNNPALKGIINYTSANPATNYEFSKALGRIMKRPSFFRVPEFVLKAVLGEKSAMVLSGQRVMPEILLSSSFNFRFGDLETALRDLAGLIN